jgi:uncharacterized protein YbjQ (UPF0145 family)
MAMAKDEILVSTMNDVPGYEITEVLGEVFGLVVRSRNLFFNITASLRGVVGGEVPEFTDLLTETRNHAIERLRASAREKGANAIIAMRFDASEMGGIFTEVVAYGTAVKIQKR